MNSWAVMKILLDLSLKYPWCQHCNGNKTYSPSLLICTFLQRWVHPFFFFPTKQASLHSGQRFSSLSLISWTSKTLATASWTSKMLATASWTSKTLAIALVLAGWTSGDSVSMILVQNCSSASLQSDSPCLDPEKKMESGARHVKQIARVLLSALTAIILLLWRLMPIADGLLTIKSDFNDPHRSAE